MKKTTIIYWVFTSLLAAGMTFSAIPDVLLDPQAIEMVSNHLGYPPYFLQLIGIAKLLGAIAIVIPGFPRIKEWAYAGFVFDLTGAMYSSIAVGDPPAAWMPILLGHLLVAGSYIYYHKRLRAKSLMDHSIQNFRLNPVS